MLTSGPPPFGGKSRARVAIRAMRLQFAGSECAAELSSAIS